MGDARRQDQFRREVLGELFGELPSTATIADLVRESNYEKLVVLCQDVLKHSGDKALAALFATFEIEYPEEHAQYKQRVAEDRQLVFTAKQKQEPKSRYLNTNKQYAPSLQEYELLLQPATNIPHIRRLGLAFVVNSGYVDVKHFAGWIDSDPQLPANNFPENWPYTMKLAACYPNLQALIVKVSSEIPPDLRGGADEFPLVTTNLIKALCLLQAEYAATAYDDD